ncbi:MAG: LamG-like jellyroll fold domain-containing protein [Thermoanaerobaculia bacterium]
MVARFAALVGLLLGAVGGAGGQTLVDQWDRHLVSLSNATHSGNPFELEVGATFTHTASGTQIVLPGYYAGSDTWKIGFMPTKTGEWTWATSSSDPDLDNKTGSLNSVASTRRGLLASDGKKWRYSDGGYIVPIGVFTQLMHGAGSTTEVEDFADFLQANNIHLVNFRLCEDDVCFDSVASKTMDLVLWDRLEERLGILAERGIGVDVMLYTDDGGKPTYAGQSDTEAFLVRYAVARLAGFPVVLFNSGIDIWEYRGSAATWHDWYGNLVNSLDPYGHPVSSRGQSGDDTSFMSASVRTYNSVGDRNSKFSRLLAAHSAAARATANNDNFGEDRTGINGHTPGDIRRTAWKALLAGGVGFHVRHNVTNDCVSGPANCDNPFTVADIGTQLDSEQWLRLVQLFTDQKLAGVFGSLFPESSLVGNGYAISDPARTTIVYLYLGVNDTWDSGSVAPLQVKLTGLLGDYDATWFDPRTGLETPVGVLAGGTDYDLTPASTDDWILFLRDEDAASRTLQITPPTDGAVSSSPPGIDCGSDCEEDYMFGGEVVLSAIPDFGFMFDDWSGDPDCWDGSVLMVVDTTCAALFAPCLVPSIVDLPAQTVDDTQTFEACNELRGGTGGFVVGVLGDATFEAGNLIRIDDGFSVAGTFRAQIGDPIALGDPPPAAPSQLTATAGDGQVTLDWQDNTESDLAGYRVYRSTTSGGPYSDVSGLTGLSSYLDTTVTNDTTYYYRVTAEDANANPSPFSNQAMATPRSGLIGHWRLDDGLGTTASDETGTSAGAVVGATWVPGVPGSGGTALDFDGTAGHVVLANTVALEITGTEITLSAWIYPHTGGVSVGSRIFSKRTEAGGSDVYALYTESNRIRFRLDGQDMISDHVFPNDEWLHVAAVYNGVDKRIYVNGVLDTATPQAKSDPIDASARAVHFGKREAEDRFFDGILDELRIYDRALSPAEIAALAAGP